PQEIRRREPADHPRRRQGAQPGYPRHHRSPAEGPRSSQSPRPDDEDGYRENPSRPGVGSHQYAPRGDRGAELGDAGKAEEDNRRGRGRLWAPQRARSGIGLHGPISAARSRTDGTEGHELKRISVKWNHLQGGHASLLPTLQGFHTIAKTASKITSVPMLK